MDIDYLKRNFDEESFRQEFLCEFIDEATAYFTYELLKSCTEDFSENLLKGKCYIGIDIGRSHDLTAIAVLIKQNERFYLKRIVLLRNVNFKTQFDIICSIFKEEQPISVYIDKGAIGMQLAEELEKRYIYVTGVQINPNVKNDCVTFCRMLMEKRNFVFNDDTEGRKLTTEFHSIKRNVSIGNQVSFDSARDKHGHADRAWAVMLSLIASKSDSEIKITAV
jgi:phage FluMu gp28-like protein